MRYPSTDDLIAQLAQNPAPVRPIRLINGAFWSAGALTITIGSVFLFDGMNVHRASGQALNWVMITNIMLGLLGLSAGIAALHMAKPQTGSRRDAPKWALAMVAVLPVVAMVDGLAHPNATAFWRDPHGAACLLQSLLAAALMMAALTLWVRRGAPANPRLAAAYIGIASGAMGAMAYGLSCPIFDMAHLFGWHAVTPIVLCGLCYILLPRVLRW